MKLYSTKNIPYPANSEDGSEKENQKHIKFFIKIIIGKAK